MDSPMKYKALMIDVDGTLAKSQEKTLPSARVTQTLHDAKDKIHIGIATGRPLFLIEDIVSHLELTGPSIVNDGGRVIDLTTRKAYYERLINPEDITLSIDVLTKHNITFAIHDGEVDVAYTPSYSRGKPRAIYTVGTDEKITNAAFDEIDKSPSLHVSKYISWINGQTGILVAHAEATKQHGVLEVAKVLGIKTSEIIGIGDGYNDFPLLMACGLKVAMGNAVPELKAIADYIAPTVDEDGVADVIEKFILNANR